MANVAHLVRASGCGSEGDGFDPRRSPQKIIKKETFAVSFYFDENYCKFGIMYLNKG